MLKFTSTLTEEKKDLIRATRNDPDHPRPALLTNGKSYYLKIEVTDDIAAEDFLINFLNRPDTIEGCEQIGFHLTEVAWGGIGKLQVYQEELRRFIDNELEQRIRVRENTNI